MTKEKIKDIATILGAVSAIVGVAGAVLLPYLRGYITEVQMENIHSPQYKFESKQLIDEFLQSAEFKLLADELIKNHDIHENADNLRADLANKMGVELDEVHIEIGRMYHRSTLNQERNQPQNDTNE